MSCNINDKLLQKIIDRWTQDGDDEPKFLENVSEHYYTLGKEHETVLSFLKQQGEIREKNSNNAKKLVEKKKRLKNKHKI